MSAVLRVYCNGCPAWIEFDTGSIRGHRDDLRERGWSAGRGYDADGTGRRPYLHFCAACTKRRAAARSELARRRA